MPAAVKLREDYSAAELRRLAKRSKDEPSVAKSGADIWPTRPRYQRLSVNELYGRN
jgi:hypothetical protein